MIPNGTPTHPMSQESQALRPPTLTHIAPSLYCVSILQLAVGVVTILEDILFGASQVPPNKRRRVGYDGEGKRRMCNQYGRAFKCIEHLQRHLRTREAVYVPLRFRGGIFSGIHSDMLFIHESI
ncbi:hypothetical protein BDV10DRAFT_115805 [Aspergillus recurvatus]